MLLFIAQTSFFNAVAHHVLLINYRNYTSEKNHLFVLGNAGKSSSAYHFRLISQCRWLPEKNNAIFTVIMAIIARQCIPRSHCKISLVYMP